MKKGRVKQMTLPHASRYCNRIPHGVAPQQNSTMLGTAIQR